MYVYLNPHDTADALRFGISGYMDYYNNRRYHSSIGGLTPSQKIFTKINIGSITPSGGTPEGVHSATTQSLKYRPHWSEKPNHYTIIREKATKEFAESVAKALRPEIFEASTAYVRHYIRAIKYL